MRTLAIQYPEAMLASLNASPEAFEAEARLALGMKLFEMGRLSSGQAAALAGVTRVAFLLDCRRFGVASVRWDETELESEFPKLLS